MEICGSSAWNGGGCLGFVGLGCVKFMGLGFMDLGMVGGFFLVMVWVDSSRR